MFCSFCLKCRPFSQCKIGEKIYSASLAATKVTQDKHSPLTHQRLLYTHSHNYIVKRNFSKSYTYFNDTSKNDTTAGNNSERPPEEPMPIKKRLLIVGAVLIIWGGVYYLATAKKKKKRLLERETQLSKTDIGAEDYNLIDHNGKAVSKKDFLGKWLLLYFGFTHCPDICPEELEKMADIIDLVDNDKSIPDLLPLFLSVDPERDTPAAIKEYVSEFHPKMVGLTGTPEDIKQASKAFRVYYSAGPKDEDNDYIVDHTIVMYLMNPKGNFVDYYGSRSVATNDIYSGIKRNMQNYARLHG
uniref:Thioredoxin domain-containing protein n=1 Tax=Ciona savignyi TaxID=51511 RepID=H2YE39_CIOSA